MTIPKYRRLIDDYYINHAHIGTQLAAFPRHYALAMGSQSSTCTILEKRLWDTARTKIGLGYSSLNEVLQQYSNIELPNTNAYFQRMFVAAKKYAHDTFEITRFTEMSGLQRDMVLAHSGIAGIVISRLFNPKWYSLQEHKETFRSRVKNSQILLKRLHSKEESEIFADNRYGKLWIQDPSRSCDVGRHIRQKLPEIEEMGLNIETAREELRSIYSSEIQKIMSMLQKFKRGLLTLDDIHETTRIDRMIILWFYCLKKLMKNQEECQGETRVACINELMGVAAEFPLMYSRDIMMLYSNSTRRLVKVSIEATLRMSSNEEESDTAWVGCRSGLLAFAAIEPRMVDQYLAPKLASCSFDGNNKREALDNHIPSRCPIFGELRKKFEVHMPRTGDCEWELCRKNGGIIKGTFPKAERW